MDYILGGMIMGVAVVCSIGLMARARKAMTPPPPKICGTPGGPPITAPRVKLRDGRYLAYKEHGVAKEKAKAKIIFVHGSASCRHDESLTANLPQEIVEELGLYFVTFDKPGYGESDPDPNRTIKSLAFDIENLADQLGLGSKFYVIGMSMGGQAVWSCLKYIPSRLAGAVLLGPVINYWWPGLPANLVTEFYSRLPFVEQCTIRVLHYLPWLVYWWHTQKWFSASKARKPESFSAEEIKLLDRVVGKKEFKRQTFQQGFFHSVHRDLIAGFESWEFSPVDLENPGKECPVHLWQGDADKICSVKLQRSIVKRLPWIHYHELPGAEHFFPAADGMSETILRALLLNDN